jgi:uncharacterized membrane protein (DUF2068 family)
MRSLGLTPAEGHALVIPLAHAGHWYEWVPFLIPVVIVLAVSIRALIQQRHEQRKREPGGSK